MNWTRITRHCANAEMYDDGGYCDTKITQYGEYYILYAEGGCETFCSECALQAILHQVGQGGMMPEYQDLWLQEFKLIRNCSRERIDAQTP